MGMCPANPGRMMMGIWGNAWSPPTAADLAHPRLSLCGFSLTALYQHLILVQVPFSPSLRASLLLPFSKRSGRSNQTDETSLWCLNCPCFFPQGEQAAKSCATRRLALASFLLRQNLLLLFRREWLSTICIL